MAFKLDYKVEIFGDAIEYKDCYLQITSMNGNKGTMQLVLSVYKNEDKSILISSKTEQFSPSVAVGSKNFFQQGYEYLKKLEEYKEAVDC